jgi:hypothetical protein
MIDLIDGTGFWNGGSSEVEEPPPDGGASDLPDVGLLRRRRGLFCIVIGLMALSTIAWIV